MLIVIDTMLMVAKAISVRVVDRASNQLRIDSAKFSLDLNLLVDVACLIS
ncbi:MAG: hypothetical protein J6M33_05700 [Anaerovibrio sp.]|nr:hypothetical protein [Anaerovibrio sp.]